MIFPTPPQRKNRYSPSGNNMLFGPGPSRSSSRQPTSSGLSSMLQPENVSSMATKGAGGLSKVLGNAQQVLSVIETTAPLIQQYGPIIKNIPALYRMMKAVSEVNNTDDSDSNNIEENKEEISVPKNTENIEDRDHEKQLDNIAKPKKQVQKRTGESKPLLFI